MRSESSLDQVWTRWTQMKMRSGGVLLLLALVSVSRAAPLCEQLLSPTDQQLDMSGRWYLHAGAGHGCELAAMMKLFQLTNMTFNLTLKETPNTYNVSVQFNVFGHCIDHVKDVNIMLSVFSTNNVTAGSLSFLSLPSCSDCVALLPSSGSTTALLFFSRRLSVTPLEQKTLQNVASCLKLPLPLFMNTDYGLRSCKDEPKINCEDEEVIRFFERLNKVKTDVEKCGQTDTEVED